MVSEVSVHRGGKGMVLQNGTHGYEVERELPL
jgi:hypothetical protein